MLAIDGKGGTGAWWAKFGGGDVTGVIQEIFSTGYFKRLCATGEGDWGKVSGEVEYCKLFLSDLCAWQGQD